MTDVIRALIGNRNGKIIGEMEPQLGPIEWRLNKMSTVDMSVSRQDEKATEEFLQFGNKVLLEFSNGLPNWGGVIEPPRGWGKHSIGIKLYSGEHLALYRTTNRGRYFSADGAGQIFQSVIEEANAVSETALIIGDVWGGGDTYSPDYHFKSLLKIIQDSITGRLSTADYAIEPVEEDGYIKFYAHLYERRGEDKANVALQEGHNATDIKYEEQGPIINVWNIPGEGTNWGDDRPVGFANNTTSIATYGLREASEVLSSVSQQDTLDGIAANRVAITANPREALLLSAVNLAPALFSDYDVGDSVTAKLPSYGFGGFDSLVKIISRTFDPATGKCALVVEVPN